MRVLSVFPLLFLAISLHVTAADLIHTEWLLEDLAGNGVLDRAPATLAFPEAGRVTGNGSCNRFGGSAEITGEHIKVGPLVGTRMACPEAVMNQEREYLAALEAAERYEQNGASLLIYSKGSEKPLRFSRRGSATASAASPASTMDQLFGRIWDLQSGATNPAPPHTIYVFLANGTLLETSCVETYRVARWRAENGPPLVLHVTEDGRPAFDATVTDVSSNTLRLRQKLTHGGEARDLALRAIETEFVCPALVK